MDTPTVVWLIVAIVGAVEILGIVAAGQAILTARTSQGAIAWSVALLTMPVLSVPLFWVFGRRKFYGYVARRRTKLRMLGIADDVRPLLVPHLDDRDNHLSGKRVLQQLGQLPFTHNNQAELLIDGPGTFAAIFAALEQAQEYVLTQFYIVRDDELGRRFQSALIACARRGVRVYLLYDEIGSHGLSRRYLRELCEAGVCVTGMKTTRGPANRFQINFRNHRKIVVADGVVAIVGGVNVGDEYLGKHRRLSPWRDTSVRIAGPAVLPVQLVFVEDWHWATQEAPQVNWRPAPGPDGNKTVFVLPSGPADLFETCGLFFTNAINSARRRVWIATPYFVPDMAVVNALQLAALRGLDVRVLMPAHSDSRMMKWAALSYVPEVASSGVKVLLYEPGFMHQKVMLIDDQAATVGTANFDNRSFRLNFEISILTIDESFAAGVARMLEADFAHAREITAREIQQRSFLFRLKVSTARLFSPVL